MDVVPDAARDDAAWMRRALALAQRGWGHAQPNPLVGAVLVSDGIVVGEGWHEVYGGPHAEVQALRAAGTAARGATLYVTLEPCAHHGRTPPCADAVAAAGVAEVVYAIADPHAAARGGADRLRQAGVRVRDGVERDAARRLNAAFLHIHGRGGPFVALKLAVSLDGGIAARAGERTDLTGAAARAETHRLRGGYDAVLVGSGTALVDDPLLTVRHADARRQPARVVIDTDARLPPTSRLATTVRTAPVYDVCAHDAPGARTAALEASGVRVLRAPRSDGGLDLHAVLDALRDAGLNSIFAEGGAVLGTALIAGHHVQRLHLFIAPRFLGTGAVRAFTLPAPLTDGWRAGDAQLFGDDALLTFDRAS